MPFAKWIVALCLALAAGVQMFALTATLMSSRPAHAAGTELAGTYRLISSSTKHLDTGEDVPNEGAKGFRGCPRPRLGPKKGWRWIGRWKASVEAIERGYIVRSVKLFSMKEYRLSARDKEFVAATSRHLQADLNQWLSDHDPSDKIKT